MVTCRSLMSLQKQVDFPQSFDIEKSHKHKLCQVSIVGVISPFCSCSLWLSVFHTHTHTHTPQDCTEEGVGYVLDACVVWKSRRELQFHLQVWAGENPDRIVRCNLLLQPPQNIVGLKATVLLYLMTMSGVPAASGWLFFYSVCIDSWRSLVNILWADGLDWRAHYCFSHTSDTLAGRLKSTAQLEWFSGASSCGLSSTLVLGKSHGLCGG